MKVNHTSLNLTTFLFPGNQPCSYDLGTLPFPANQLCSYALLRLEHMTDTSPLFAISEILSAKFCFVDLDHGLLRDWNSVAVGQVI